MSATYRRPRCALASPAIAGLAGRAPAWLVVVALVAGGTMGTPRAVAEENPSAADGALEGSGDESSDYSSQTRARAPAGERADAGGPRTALDLSGTADGNSSLDRELDDAPSVQVRRSGGYGAPAYLSVRGSDSAQVRVLLDGIPLTGAGSTAFDLSAIPLDLLGGATVYRSGVPVQLGAPLPGGALDLQTRFEQSDGAFVRVGAGSFGTRRVAAAHQAAAGGGHVLVSGVYAGAENRFRFFDDHGTPLNLDDGGETRRRNAGLDGGGLLVRHRVRVERWRLTTVGLGTGDHRGLPGLAADQALHTSLARGRALIAVRAERGRWPSDAVDVAFLGAASLESERYRDPDDELGLGAQDTRRLSWLTLVGIRPSVIASPHLRMNAVLDYNAEGTRPRSGAVGERAARRDTVAAGAEIVANAWDERLEFDVGGRADLSASRSDPPRGDVAGGATHASTVAWSPHAGVAIEPWTDRTWSVRGYATAGMADRVPGFFELYGDRGTTVGNPDLRSERRLGYDLGVQFAAETEGLESSVTWGFFDRSIDDLIVFVDSGLGVSTPLNVGRAAMRGHELAGKLAWREHLELAGTYTLMDALDRTAGDRRGARLPGRPVHSGAVTATGRWQSVELGYRLHGNGTTYLDRSESRPVPRRLEHDATLTLRPEWRWRPTLALSVHNLANSRTETVPLPDGGTTRHVPRAIGDFGGQPLPGRAFYATLTLRPARR